MPDLVVELSGCSSVADRREYRFTAVRLARMHDMAEVPHGVEPPTAQAFLVAARNAFQIGRGGDAAAAFAVGAIAPPPGISSDIGSKHADCLSI